jgi:predicted Ser/Thr protein kinase
MSVGDPTPASGGDARPAAPEDDATRVVARAAEAAAPGPAGAPWSQLAHLQAGQLLGHTYQIEARLGRGGMGEVYRARHIELNSLHAIKVILPEFATDQRVVTMFTEEARKLRMVRHDAVVAYDGMFRDENGLRYLVMEFVDGVPLAKVMRERTLSTDELRRLRDRLAQGLAAAHDKLIYHRDISPDNIILVDGKVEQAKIIDFGIAKAAGAGERTIIGSDFAGKFSYVSPEQLGMFGGKVDGRSDIYSLGLVLAAAALGRPLAMGDSPASTIEARRSVPDLSGLPADLRAEIAPMLEPDPANRPRSMRDLLGAGHSGATGEERAARGKTPGAPPPPARRALVPGLAVAALSAVIVVAVGVYFVRPDLLPLGRAKPPVVPATPTVATTAPETPTTAPGGEPPPQVAIAPSPPPTTSPAIPPPATTPSPALASEPGHPAPPSPTTATAPPAPPAVPVVKPPPSPPAVAAVTPPPAPPARHVDASEVAARVAEVTRGFKCADVTPTLNDNLDLKLAGFVSSAADETRLRQALAGIPDLGRVGGSVAVYVWPHCEMVKLLGESGALASAAAPRLDFNIPSLTYRAGDRLIVRASAGGAFGGYLYVDFFDNAGQVLHMLPGAKRPNNALKASETVTLGSEAPGGNDLVYEIDEPFGPNLVVAIFAPAKLFEPRPTQEDAHAYLPLLTRALKAEARKSPATTAAYTFINTVAR